MLNLVKSKLIYRPISEQGIPSVETAAVRNLPSGVLDGGENGARSVTTAIVVTPNAMPTEQMMAINAAVTTRVFFLSLMLELLVLSDLSRFWNKSKSSSCND